MVAEDYQLVLSMIGNEEVPDDYSEYRPCSVGLCQCGIQTGLENIN